MCVGGFFKSISKPLKQKKHEYGNISHELTPEQRDAVQNAIDILNAQLNFFVNLTPAERKTFNKLGDNDAEMISDVTYCINNKPEIFPANSEYVSGVSEWLNDQLPVLCEE